MITLICEKCHKEGRYYRMKILCRKCYDKSVKKSCGIFVKNLEHYKTEYRRLYKRIFLDATYTMDDIQSFVSDDMTDNDRNLIADLINYLQENDMRHKNE